MINKVYLAGGLKSNWQDIVKKSCQSRFIFFDPRKSNVSKNPDLYTTWDLFHISKCDIFFGYMESSNPSGYGLALELGYAKGLNKTIILVDERSNPDDNFKRYFDIVRKTSDSCFSKLEDGVEFLKCF